ncbi:MAG TPA: PsiF family protein [Steroidobacteraceae bacterium]|nr:PsiF family protein [Steroidobacteraceae bacterium]
MKAATGLLILALGAASSVWAADGSGSAPTASPPATATVKQLSPQQQKMKSCNADAKTKSLSGDARKSFMKSCLSGDSAGTAAAPTTPQERMKSCNAQAKTQALTGDARKSFMKTCLKAS